MIQRGEIPWMRNGVRAATEAQQPGRFIDQHVLPLFFRRTKSGPPAGARHDILLEEQFWNRGDRIIFGAVQLKGFRLTDWFPRVPGVYWSDHARFARENVWAEPPNNDAELGQYVSPRSKMSLIEEGGIGTIRLRPRRIDEEDCWLATALSGTECHRGIPLVIPNTVLQGAGVGWGDTVTLQGHVRFLQDAGLEDTAARVHHARPLIVFVEELEGSRSERSPKPIVITPVALFESTERQTRHEYRSAQYTFVHCAAGSDSELTAAADWIERYATKYNGRVVTNFDEQYPVMADAPLSYQRLVAKTYDRAVIKHFHGNIQVDSIDQIVQELGEIHMGHKINVGGSAIINIGTVLSNVTQTIRSAHGLNPEQKSRLEELIRPLKADLDNLKSNHPEEAKEIAEALEKVVAHAAKPAEERKKSFLELSAKGLKEAAELVKDVAPSILTTVGLIAKFVVGL